MVIAIGEERLADGLRRAGLRFEREAPFGTSGNYCRSRFPCRCGADRCDPDTGEWEEGFDSEGGDGCKWFVPPVAKYRADFLIEGKLVVEVDSKAFHGDPITKLRDRQKDDYFRAQRLHVIRVMTRELLRLPVDDFVELVQMQLKQWTWSCGDHTVISRSGAIRLTVSA